MSDRDASINNLMRVLRPTRAEGFSPTVEQNETYEGRAGAMRPFLQLVLPPDGFSADEWAICRAYLLITAEDIFRDGPANAETIARASAAFNELWPQLMERLGAYMGKTWSDIEANQASSKPAYSVKNFEINTDNDTGLSSISVETKEGPSFVFHDCYPVSISITQLPDAGVTDDK